MKDNSKLTAVILVIITFVVVIGTFIYNNINKNKQDNDIKIVTNYSNFYTVNSCLYRVITYLNSNDTKSLMLILDNNYKKQNNISEDNIMSLFESIDSDSTFVSNKMYYQEINSNITKYYVSGHIEKNQLYDEDYTNSLETKQVYFIVYLDTTNKTFSIEPYSGEIFINGDVDER